MQRALIARLVLTAALLGWPATLPAAEAPSPAPSGRPAARELRFDQLPKPAQEALVAVHRREATTPYACFGLSQKAYPAAVGLLFETDYNGDGEPDYIFRSPCRSPQPAGPSAPRDSILLSGPYGYAVGEKFAAALGSIMGRPALLAPAPCKDDDPADEQPGCYLGRLLDPATARWGAIQKISLRPDGGGYVLSPYPPLAARAPAPTPQPVSAPVEPPTAVKPPAAGIAAIQPPHEASAPVKPGPALAAKPSPATAAIEPIRKAPAPAKPSPALAAVTPAPAPKPVSAPVGLPPAAKPPPSATAAIDLPHKAATPVKPAPAEAAKPAKVASADILDRLDAELAALKTAAASRPSVPAPPKAKPVTLPDLHRRAAELGVEGGH